MGDQNRDSNLLMISPTVPISGSVDLYVSGHLWTVNDLSHCWNHVSWALSHSSCPISDPQTSVFPEGMWVNRP